MGDEVEEMEEFGGGAGSKDDELEMKSNPLVVQMADMQRNLDENKKKLAAEQSAQLRQESQDRQDHISTLSLDRERLAAELDRLKAKLSTQVQTTQPKPQIMDAPVDSSGTLLVAPISAKTKTQFTSQMRPKK